MLYYSFFAYFTAGSSRDGEPTMPEALLDNKHEMDDWRHVDTVSFVIKRFSFSRKVHVLAGVVLNSLILEAVCQDGQSCLKCQAEKWS